MNCVVIYIHSKHYNMPLHTITANRNCMQPTIAFNILDNSEHHHQIGNFIGKLTDKLKPGKRNHDLKHQDLVPGQGRT